MSHIRVSDERMNMIIPSECSCASIRYLHPMSALSSQPLRLPLCCDSSARRPIRLLLEPRTRGEEEAMRSRRSTFASSPSRLSRQGSGISELRRARIGCDAEGRGHRLSERRTNNERNTAAGCGTHASSTGTTSETRSLPLKHWCGAALLC
jgi:hypothetical protein